MNTLTNEKLAEQLGTPERLTDSYLVAVASATNAGANGFKIKNILVAARPSKSSGEALKYAGWLASQLDCKITVLCAVASGGSDVSPQELRSEISRTTGIEASQIRAILIRQGVADVLPVITAAHGEQTDLIIIPADFYKPSVRFWQRDMMEQLICRAPCPLLIVGGKVRQSIFK